MTEMEKVIRNICSFGFSSFSIYCHNVVHWLFSCGFFFPEKRVKRFTLHPNYNVNAKVKEGVKEFYDYDVALVQLEEDVQISSTVRWGQKDLDLIVSSSAASFHARIAGFRPICIPCTKQTSGALGLVDDSTCKQQGEVTPVTSRNSVYNTWDSRRAKVPLQSMPNWSPEVCILQVFACMMWHTCRSGSETGRQSCIRCSINNGFELKTKS